MEYRVPIRDRKKKKKTERINSVLSEYTRSYL